MTVHSRRLQGLGGWDLEGHVARQESETWTRPLDLDGIRRGLMEGWEASRAVKASSRRRIHARGMAVLFILSRQSNEIGDIAERERESHSSRFGRKRARFHVVLSHQLYDAADQENITTYSPYI